MGIAPAFSPRKDVRDGRRLLCERLYRSLSHALAMPEAELRQLVDFEPRLISVAPGRMLQEEGGVARSKILVSGWACQQRILENGRRQIFSFFIPGDPLNGRPGGMTHASLVAVTKMVLLDATQLEEKARLPGAHAGLVNYFARMEQRRISFLYNHILRLGSETAYERLHSLLKELFQRLSQAGFCYNNSVQLPLTQETLGDALGVSAVHINRVLQQMRRDGVVKLEDGRLLLGAEVERIQ